MSSEGKICVDGSCVPPTSNGASSSSSGGAGPGCESSTQCTTDLGSPHLCRNGTCVPVLSEDCSEVLGKYDDPNAILFGMLSAFSPGPDQHNSKEQSYDVQLALGEFKDIAGGLPSPAGPKRPLAVVGCDEDKDAVRAAKHLVDDLGIVAIMGPLRDSHAFDVANEPNSVSEVGALVGSVHDVEAKIRADRGLTPSDSIKVMIIDRGDDDGKRLADLVMSTLTFNYDAMGNPKTVAQNLADMQFERIDYSIAGGADYQTDVVAPTLAFAPDIIVGIAGGYLELTKNIEDGLE